MKKSIQEIVLNLLDDLINKGYFLYMDNFYNSVNLSELLLSKNTYVCGTLRKNRGEPEEIKKSCILFKIWRNSLYEMGSNIYSIMV